MRKTNWLLGLLIISLLLPAMALANSGTAPKWEDVMRGMDWSGASCDYTVGEGSRAVHVTREGKNVTFSGGEIASVVRFADMTNKQNYHTESGSYTFHNVTLLDDIYVWARDGEDYTITLDASVKGSYGMICELKNGANLNLINNDIIYCDSNYSMIIQAETDCSMSITGNGKILIGEGEDWSGVEGVRDEVPIRVQLRTLAKDNREALENIRRFEGNVLVSYDQVKIANGYPPIRSYCVYQTTSNGEDFDVIDPDTGDPYKIDTTYIVKKLRPGKGAMTEPILAGEEELDEGALYRPLLIAEGEGENYLRSEIMQEVKGKSIEYEIHMVNAGDEQVKLTDRSALYIPYPEGMDMESAAEYAVTIRHITSTGVEPFSTADGSIELTPYGFLIHVSSLSPFEISWANPAAAGAGSLPRTGDDSRFGLYALLLALTAGALALRRRDKKSPSL